MEKINVENAAVENASTTSQTQTLRPAFKTMVAGLFFVACNKTTDESPTVNVDKNLITFDTLDFKVFTNQQWTRMHESHADNIKVVMPDGSITTKLDDHIQNIKWVFSFAPDTRILEHPIRFGSGKYTAVTGYMLGTFTKPMYLPNGAVVQPTGKSYKLTMCTIGVWENGVMIEEQLFWDNQSFFKQLGL
jgi:hypothetical protein